MAPFLPAFSVYPNGATEAEVQALDSRGPGEETRVEISARLPSGLVYHGPSLGNKARAYKLSWAGLDYHRPSPGNHRVASELGWAGL